MNSRDPQPEAGTGQSGQPGESGEAGESRLRLLPDGRILAHGLTPRLSELIRECVAPRPSDPRPDDSLPCPSTTTSKS